jgi:hypothetical protein
MKISHEYLLEQLRPYFNEARKLDDVFPAYMLGMVLEYCEAVVKDNEPPLKIPEPQPKPPIKRKLILMPSPYLTSDQI